MTRTLAALAAALITAVLTAAVAIPATPSMAESRSRGTQVVSHLDLDLGSDEGMKTLWHRVEAAIDDVCGDMTITSLGARSNVARCKATARAGVAPQIERAVDRFQRTSSPLTDILGIAR